MLDSELPSVLLPLLKPSYLPRDEATSITSERVITKLGFTLAGAVAELMQACSVGIRCLNYARQLQPIHDILSLEGQGDRDKADLLAAACRDPRRPRKPNVYRVSSGHIRNLYKLCFRHLCAATRVAANDAHALGKLMNKVTANYNSIVINEKLQGGVAGVAARTATAFNAALDVYSEALALQPSNVQRLCGFHGE